MFAGVAQKLLIVERTFVADQVNLILNDPSVRPHIGGDGESYSDATKFVESEECLVFLCSDENGIGACFIVYPHTPHLYECHTQALPHFRGKRCLEAAKVCIDTIFGETDCIKLFGRTPTENKAANFFNRKLGFELEGCLTSSAINRGKVIDENIYGLRSEAWAQIQ